MQERRAAAASSRVSVAGQGIALKLAAETLRIDFLQPGIVRVRKFSGGEPPPPPLIRYGLFRGQWPPVKFNVTEDKRTVTATTELLAVTIARGDGKSGGRLPGGRLSPFPA